jgi:DNA-binding NtrC family response regulator
MNNPLTAKDLKPVETELTGNRSDHRILLVEDEQAIAAVYREYLNGRPYRITEATTGQQAIEAIEEHIPDAILLDLQLPDMNGRKILEYVTARALPTAVIVITGHGSVDVAVEIMQAGAFDFIEKPFTADRLVVTLDNALKRQNLEEVVDLFRRDHFHGFVGSSLAMQSVYQIICSAASSKATVFITGESGTGKEVCAQAIHAESPRRDKPFIALNCAAIPRDLMESEIFGHVKGAFTGAVAAREGAAVRADGGTLFLDEICEMDLDLQSKLLRFIQTSSFQKVGGSKLQQADLRYICATNKDPLEEVKAGRFREDLYYRLHVIPIELPALRVREEDILQIAQHFLERYSNEENKRFTHFAPETEAVLQHYDWPGNVRQLQNVVRNMVVLHDSDTVTPPMLPPPLNEIGITAQGRATATAEPAGTPAADGSQLAGQGTAVRPLWQIEKDVIERAIAHCNGNIPKAAALLEISPSTIYRKRQRWEPDS